MGAKPPHRRMAQGRKTYHTHARARNGNKVRTKNVRIYGEHGVCNTLCLFMDHGWGRSYSLWSVPFKIKQKTVEGTDTPYEKGKKIINKPAANGVSTLLGKENQRKELRPTVV